MRQSSRRMAARERLAQHSPPRAGSVPCSRTRSRDRVRADVKNQAKRGSYGGALERHRQPERLLESLPRIPAMRNASPARIAPSATAIGPPSTTARRRSTRRSVTTPAAPTPAPSASSTSGSTAAGSRTHASPPTSPSSTTRGAPPARRTTGPATLLPALRRRNLREARNAVRHVDLAP